MSAEWAIRLPMSKARAAAALRLRAGISVAELDDSFWLRGTNFNDELDIELRKLPGAERFDLSDDGMLRPEGSRLPTGTLPQADWTAISTWFAFDPQPAALAGRSSRRVKLRLVRASDEAPASALLTSHHDWLAFAIGAPLVRLQRLQFAVDRTGRVLVRGEPLPSIPGRQLVERDGIAVPCGFSISPPVDSATVRGLLGISTKDLAVFDEDGSVEIIADHELLPATRASVRATAIQLNN